MKAGVTTSVVAHAALLIIVIVGLGSARPLDEPMTDSISVDLVPVSALTSIRAGSLDSKVVETETPAVVKDDKPAEIAKPTGNTEENQVTKAETEKATPAPVINTAPLPELQPIPEPDPTPETTAETQPDAAPEPVQTQPDPAPAAPPVADPMEDQSATALATPDAADTPADAVPQPVLRTAELEQLRLDYQKQVQAEADAKAAAAKKAADDAKAEADAAAAQKAADAKAAADAATKKKAEDAKKAADAAKKKADAAKKAADAKKQADAQQRSQQANVADDKAARAADQLNQLLNENDSRGATTGAGGEPTLGKSTGNAATLSQSDMDGLRAAMLACFNPSLEAIAENATATVDVMLTRDGMVSGMPTVVAVTGQNGPNTGSAAVRAVQKCGQGGYKMLPPDLYDGDQGWNAVRVTFQAADVAR